MSKRARPTGARSRRRRREGKLVTEREPFLWNDLPESLRQSAKPDQLGWSWSAEEGWTWSAVVMFVKRVEQLASGVLAELGIDVADAAGLARQAHARWDDESVSMREQRAAKLLLLSRQLERSYKRAPDEARRLVSAAIEVATLHATLKAELADDVPLARRKTITRAAYLKARREHPTLTLEELAAKLGYDVSVLHRWRKKNLERP